MTETKSAATGNGLYAALASVQADLPRVAKVKTGEVKKEGKKVYDYAYADLTDVSEAIMPLLGGNGLAFTAWPTLNANGTFVLAYKLVHGPSGEKDEGEYPLPSSGTPQDIGKAITYGRRYCLCAVTGIAPGGDDNDAADVPAHGMDRSRDAWDNATPARPASGNGNGKPANGSAPKPPAETDEAWLTDMMQQVTKFATDDDGRVLWRRVNEKIEAGGCTSEDGDKLKELIRARHRDLDKPAEAAQEPVPAGAP